MKLIDQHTKKIMEECKSRARDAGLSFDNESLEYIVTNADLLNLSPKVMIPTLYDYWVHDVEVLKEHGKYKLYPSNPYETVINSRPAISFYNDNNPDWLNIMIFYHVIGHIDFFQNNILFQNTWNDDFVGAALADKRLIASLRSEHGRFVDYVIEFSRSIDNITGYFSMLSKHNFPNTMELPEKLNFYFDVFLQEIEHVPVHTLYAQVEKYNNLFASHKELAENMFFSDVRQKYPEFQAKFEKFSARKEQPLDIMEFIRDNSPMFRKDGNNWMKSVMTIVRNTANYFAPQIRSKIANEGWASYWHDELFRSDERIKGHESAYAKLNAGVTSISRVGLNPYAIGLRLIQHVEELAERGQMDFEFQKIENMETRASYNKKTGKGKDAIFALRRDFSDFMLINTFVSQDFVDKHDLFVVGQRPNPQRGTIEYYIKSKKAHDYKDMLLTSLYHPPVISVVPEKTDDKTIYLTHKFEKKQLVKDFIPDVMMGVEYLWGGEVQLETTEIVVKDAAKKIFDYKKVLYTMKDKKISKKELT